MSTPYERRVADLMTELIPSRPTPPRRPDPPPRPLTAWTREEQDAHWAELCKEVGTPEARRPHLRAVPEPADSDAA